MKKNALSVFCPGKTLLVCHLKILRILVVGCLLLIPNLMYAQMKTVTGVVSDNSGPLAGANVSVKGTSIASVANSDGKFSIKVPSEQSTLVISFIGYTAQEILVGKRNQFTITLKADNNLEELVVIGYGKTKKDDITGAVGTVNMKDFNKAPVKSLDEALGGRIAGVQVVSPDGQPGNNADIVVRGVGTFSSNAGPLYVVDGFPQEGNAFNNINPNDIESITVLKDASSTAIYGARGSNGVILVTTKKGTLNQPTINYNGYYGQQSILKKMDVMDAYEFVRLQRDLAAALNNSAVTTFVNNSYFADGKTLDSYRDVQGIDWQDKMFTNAPYQSHSLSLSGRSNGTNYFISGNITDQTGLLVNSGFKRYQGRVNLEQTINDKLKLGFVNNYSAVSSFGTVTSVQTPSVGTTANSNNAQLNLMFNIWAFRPIGDNGNLESLTGAFYDLGTTDIGQGRVNPYITTMNELDNRQEKNLSSNAYLQYSFTKDLVLRVSGGLTNITSERSVFHNSLTRSGAPINPFGAVNVNGQNGGISTNEFSSYLNENILTYNKTIAKKHTINAVAGFTLQKNNSKGSGFNSIQVPNENLGISGLDEGVPFGTNASYSSNSAIMSYLGRLNYGYQGKYIFTFSFRADGSSKFAPQHKWGYFPSGAIAWQLGKEKFFQGELKKVISTAKLRASYGVTGNNRVSDFAYQSAIVNPASARAVWNNNTVSGSVPSTIYNPELTWERAASLDLGLEMGFLKDRFNLEVDYYSKKTNDLLLNSTISTITGFGSANQNIGNIRNEGIEIAFSSNNITTKNFSWNTSVNISFNRNRVLKLSSGQEARTDNSASNAFSADFNTPLYIAKIGQPVAQFYGYLNNGLYQVSDFDRIQTGTGMTYVLRDGIPYYGTRSVIQPGDLKYRDLNGDGLVNNSDLAIIGSPYPIHIGGISNNFTYKGFDLNVFLQWSYGNDVFNGNRIRMETNTTGDLRGLGLNMFSSYSDRWSFDNQGAQYQRVNATGVRFFSDRFVEDASFLRLKTVSLGYNFSKNFVKKIGLSSTRVYFTAQNLYTWTKYKGPDPEVSTRNSPLTPGFDFSPYPRTRVLVFGLNASL